MKLLNYFRLSATLGKCRIQGFVSQNNFMAIEYHNKEICETNNMHIYNLKLLVI